MLYHPRLLLVVALLCSACALPRELPLGNYHETRGPGVMMWTSKQLRILPGNTFKYVYSTDDESGWYGAGTYQLIGRKLRLTFDGKPLVPASCAEPRALPAHSDSLQLQVEVYLVGKDTVEVASYVSLLVQNAAHQIKAAVGTNASGRAAVSIAPAWGASTFSLRRLGYQALEQPMPQASTAYKVYLQPFLGALYDAGTVMKLEVLEETPQQLVLRWGLHKTAFIYRP